MKKLLLIMPMLAIAANTPDLAQLDKMIARFTPTELRADISKLSPGDRQALAKLIEASRVLDDIFLQSVVERQPAAVCQAPPRHNAARQGPAALFLDQQGTLVRVWMMGSRSCPTCRRRSCRARISIPKT